MHYAVNTYIGPSHMDARGNVFGHDRDAADAFARRCRTGGSSRSGSGDPAATTVECDCETWEANLARRPAY